MSKDFYGNDKIYNIVFKGKIKESFSSAEVKSNLCNLLNKDPAEIEKILSAERVTFGKKLSKSDANKKAEALSSLGLVISLEEVVQNESNNTNNSDTSSSKSEQKINHDNQDQQRISIMNDNSNNDVKADNIGLGQRLRYRFDTFMAKGGSSILKALVFVFLVIFFFIAAARGLLQLFAPEIALQYENLDFFGNIYITFLQMTDPGNMAQDILSSVWYKLFAVLSGLAGIILLSALIAFITTAMDQKINELKRGRSKVIEFEHTLILGWNEQRVIEILRELIMANESEEDACVVILADVDKEEMDDVLRLRLPDTATTRIVTRSGRVSTIANLDMVSIEQCKSIIILAGCGDVASNEEKAASDAMVIQTILATTGKGPNDEDFSIVAEIFNPAHREIVESTFPEHVVTVNTSDILAKLLVQTSRSVGLSVVYNEILSFDGCEMYFHNAEWGNVTFSDIAYRFEDGVPMGIRKSSGEVMMNPSFDYRMQEDDDILIVADDDSTIQYESKPVAIPNNFQLASERLSQKIEKELIIGWNHKAPIIIEEFSDYVKQDSIIHVMLNNPTELEYQEIEKLDKELDSIEITLIEKDYLNREHLLALEPFNYDNIIILAGSSNDGEEVDVQLVDSENIVTLLLLRSIFNEYPDESKNTKLITEVLDSQNYPLVVRAGVKDIIISNRLVSMIMAQISESRDIKQVYDDIFEEDGSEIYLKPASLYFKEFPVDLTFADMMATAQKRQEVCIGVKLKENESDSEKNNGVQLIPLKETSFTLTANDALVVLAEDEL